MGKNKGKGKLQGDGGTSQPERKIGEIPDEPTFPTSGEGHETSDAIFASKVQANEPQAGGKNQGFFVFPAPPKVEIANNVYIFAPTTLEKEIFPLCPVLTDPVFSAPTDNNYVRLSFSLLKAIMIPDTSSTFMQAALTNPAARWEYACLSDASDLFENENMDYEHTINFLVDSSPFLASEYGKILKLLIDPPIFSPEGIPFLSHEDALGKGEHLAPKECVLIDRDGQCNWVPAKTNILNETMATAQKNCILVEGSLQQPPRVLAVPSHSKVGATSLFNLKSLSKLAIHFVTFNLPPLWGTYGDPPADWKSDAYFVEQRLRGVNPCDLTHVRLEDLSSHFSRIKDFNQTGATFFKCDYHRLTTVTAQLPATGHYVPAPLCVFRFNPTEASMKVIAILIDQTVPAGSRQVVYYDDQKPDKWLYAKTCVRVADWNVHELGSHLTLAHITSEVACAVTQRTLPQQHPVFQLLLPHFFRTLSLNDQARAVLVPYFIGSRLSGLNEKQCFEFCAAVFKDWNFSNYPPNDLEERGVSTLPPNLYPYATTAAAAWECIHTYVASVLEHLAEIDQKKNLLHCAYLRDWCQEMKVHIATFPVVQTIGDLCNAISMIIFTATHQHSAVNYFQYKYMQHLPSSPGYLKSPPPANLNAFKENDVMEALPGYRAAYLQRALVEMLSEPPNEDHRLSEFSFRTSPQFLSCSILDEHLTDFQSSLRGHLGIYEFPLAQSVLI